MSKKNVPQKLFVAIDPELGPRFAFNAPDWLHAKSLINGWNLYHGFNDVSTKHIVREIQQSELTVSIHNEYVK